MKMILLIIMMLSANQLCSAETINLKSGKVITGKIIERTKTGVKVDIEGVPITYYFDAIESIDGKVTSVSSNPETKIPDFSKGEKIYYADKPAGGEGSKPKNWENWAFSAAGYLSQLQILSAELRQIGDDAKQKMSPLDQKSKLSVLDEVIGKTLAVKKRAESLTPPAELRVYHEKFLRSADIYLELAKSLKANPDASQIELFKQLESNAIEIMEEARRVYVQQGIPPELLSQVDMEISRGRSVLNAMEERVRAVEENRNK